MPSILSTSTLSTLADLKLPIDIHISPDGTKVVYALESFTKNDKKTTSSLWIADVNVNHSARQITSGHFRDEKPQWAPDGRGIAFVSDRGNKGQDRGIYLLSFGGFGEAVALTEGVDVNGRFEWSSDGNFVAFTSADGGPERYTEEANADEPIIFGGEDDEGSSGRNQRLRVVDVRSKTLKTLTPASENVHLFSWAPVSHLYPDEIAYTVSDIDASTATHFSNTRIDISSITGGSRSIIKSKTHITSLTWTQKDRLHFISRPLPPYTVPAVYEARIKTKQYGSYFGWTGEALSLHRTQDSVIARIQNTTSESAHALGIEDSSWPFPSFFTSEYEITSLDAHRHTGTNNGFTLVIARSSPSSANEIWSATTQGAETGSGSGSGKGYNLVKLSSHNSHFDGFRSKRISTTAPDGWECDGWLFTPKQLTLSRRLPPTVVLLQSHPKLPSFSMGEHLDVATLTTAGYAVLCPNIRPSPSPSTLSSAPPTPSQSTLSDAYTSTLTILREAVSQNLIDESRVTISGWSSGGFLSSLGVLRNEFSFRAVVCGGGVVDWEFVDVNVLADPFWGEGEVSSVIFSPSSGSGGRGRTGGLGFGSLTENMNGLKNTEAGMKERKTPLLILHGRDDEIVPVSAPLAFWRQKGRWEGAVQMVLYPREGHVVRERRNFLDLWTRVLGFYSKHLDRY
ncbi:Alpha/Beta hydrolase protein [Aspergillus karnatakaensis]|uniref:S9 family peptidase n=1 Tax=Aspergillus karnatakaensis TaxID=1810916 RepID=UPI003CCE51DD